MATHSIVDYTTKIKSYFSSKQELEISNAEIDATKFATYIGDEHIYKAGKLTDYTTGVSALTTIYLLTKGDNFVIIPKGSKVVNFRLLVTPGSNHTISVYFLEYQGGTFKVLKKYNGLTPDINGDIVITSESVETDIYIGVRAETAYGLKNVIGEAADRTSGVLVRATNAGDPNVGDTFTPTRFDSKIAYNVDLTIRHPKIETSKVGNALFPFKNNDITNEVEWITGKNLNTFTPDYTINNYQYNLGESTVCDVSKPIRVRAEDGSLIFDIYTTDIASPDAGIMLEFDKNGIYLRKLSYQAFEANGFSNDAYYAVICKYNNLNQKYYLKKTTLEWLDTDKPSYTVGAGGDFQTFTEMLVALKGNSKPKIVYVKEDTYDIYEEMGGASFLASITDPSTTNWRDVCNIVPDNTDIIGVGKVVLRWEPSDAAVGSNDMAFLFSPLNLSGTASIENIEIVCTNCRYAIHDEVSAPNTPWHTVNRRFKNVYAKKIQGTYHRTGQVYGAGIAASGCYEYENCIFEGDSSWYLFSAHTNSMTANDKPVLNIKNCVVRDLNGTAPQNRNPIMAFGSTAQAQRYVDVNIDNCYLGGNIRKYPEGDIAGVYNAYKIVMIGCNDINIENTTATDALNTMKYNAIS